LGVAKGLAPARPFDLAALFLDNYIPQPATFISRSALDELGFLDDSLHYVMDYELWLRIGLRSARVEPIVGPALAAFRRHTAAKTAVSEHRFWLEIITVFQRLFAGSVLPTAARAVEQRALARAHWGAALGCYDAGLITDARSHAALSVDRYGLLRQDSDWAVHGLIYGPGGGHLSGGRSRNTPADLSSGSRQWRRFARTAQAHQDVAHLFQALGAQRRHQGLTELAADRRPGSAGKRSSHVSRAFAKRLLGVAVLLARARRCPSRA
jgi:hypothetical protein